VIVRQMLRRVQITDAAETKFITGEHVGWKRPHDCGR
jgi:hypothetical protein